MSGGRRGFCPLFWWDSGLGWNLPGSPHNQLPALVEVSPDSGATSRQGNGVTVGDGKAGSERPAVGRSVLCLLRPLGKGPLGASPPCKFPQSLAGERPPHTMSLLKGNTPICVFSERMNKS